MTMPGYFDKGKLKRFWQRVFDLIWKKDLFFNASAITFNLFICAVPFTLILISILGYILSIDAAFNELVRYGRELLPSFTFETQSGDVVEGAVTLERLIMPLVSGRRLFGIIGLTILIFFAQGLFHTLKHVLFQVFDIEERKHPVIEFIYNFFTFGVIGGVFIFFTMAISLISLFTTNQVIIPYTDYVIELNWMIEMFTKLLPVVFTFLLFYIIYRYISEKRLDKKTAFVGAVVYTSLFEIARLGVSLYLEHAFTAYQYLYQGYTALIILGLWVFYSAVLFVVAAIIARAFKEVYMADQPTIEKNPYTAIS
jgi:YihY family inner membrane protein